MGYGRVGKRIADALDSQNIAYVVAEQNRERVEDLRQLGKAAVSGDATEPEVLIQAHIQHAAMLVIATPDTLNVRRMSEIAQKLNPGIKLVIRTHSEDEMNFIREEKLGTVFFGEEELAKGMIQHILGAFGSETPKPKAA